jgi:imidazolonepropionase-like amidohydrolase
MRYIFLICLTCLCKRPVFCQVHLHAYALTHVTIIDVNHKIPLEHQTVLIKENMIDNIFPDSTKSIPESITVFNMTGKFLVPGLIDTHVHLATDPSGSDSRASTLKTLQKMLYTGITSVRDMAGDARTLSGLSRDALVGDIMAPDIYYSALMAGPEFFDDPRSVLTALGGVAGQMPYMRAVSDSTNMVLAVAEAKGTGATGIKLYADFSAGLVNKIVAESKKQHMMVWAHAWLSPAKPSDLVKAGVGSISHAKMLLNEVMDSVPASWKKAGLSDKFWNDSVPDNKVLFALMHEHHTILDATLATYKKWGKAEPDKEYLYEISKKMTARAYRAGVKICAGTDDDQEGFVQNEMQLLVEDAGFSPIDALIAATQNGADAIGIGNKTGSVETKKVADLVVLDKNPLERMDNIKTVYLVIKGGMIFKN